MKRLTKYIFGFSILSLLPSPILTQALILRSGLEVQAPEHERSINPKPTFQGVLWRQMRWMTPYCEVDSSQVLPQNVHGFLLQISFAAAYIPTPLGYRHPQKVSQSYFIPSSWHWVSQQVSNRSPLSGNLGVQALSCLSLHSTPRLANCFSKPFYVCLFFSSFI